MKPTDSLFLFFAVILALFSTAACGVKGRPLPPLTAPPIGRGQPTMAQPEGVVTPSPTPLKPSPSGRGQ